MVYTIQKQKKCYKSKNNPCDRGKRGEKAILFLSYFNAIIKKLEKRGKLLQNEISNDIML